MPRREFAAVFLRTWMGHDEHERAKAELKNLMPEDAKGSDGTWRADQAPVQ
jgi:hypothetical protein